MRDVVGEPVLESNTADDAAKDAGILDGSPVASEAG